MRRPGRVLLGGAARGLALLCLARRQPLTLGLTSGYTLLTPERGLGLHRNGWGRGEGAAEEGLDADANFFLAQADHAVRGGKTAVIRAGLERAGLAFEPLAGGIHGGEPLWQLRPEQGESWDPAQSGKVGRAGIIANKAIGLVQKAHELGDRVRSHHGLFAVSQPPFPLFGVTSDF